MRKKRAWINFFILTLGLFCILNKPIYAAERLNEDTAQVIPLKLDQKQGGVIAPGMKSVYQLNVPRAQSGVSEITYYLGAASKENITMELYDQTGVKVNGMEELGTNSNPVMKGNLNSEESYYLVISGQDIDISRKFEVIWSSECSIFKMEITNFPKDVYYKDLDQEISYDGLKINITYGDSKTEEVSAGDLTRQGFQIIPKTTLDLSQCQVGDIEGVTIKVDNYEKEYIVTVKGFGEAKATALKEGEINTVSGQQAYQAQKYLFTTSKCGYVKLTGNRKASYQIYEKESDGARGSLVETWSPVSETEKGIELIPYREYYLLTYSSANNEKEAYPVGFYPHDLSDWVVVKAATCTETGVRGKKCSVCKEIIEREVIAATGHRWDAGTITKEATCTETGIRVYKCLNSGCPETKREIIAVIPHKPGAWMIEKAATCTEAGIKVKKCSVCNKVIERETIAAKGHIYSDWVIQEPTIFRDGYKVRKCTQCGIEEKVILKKLSAKVKLNVSSAPLQLRKSTTAIKVKSKNATDQVSKWTSSNKKIITVNARTGKITAKKVGKAYVIVTMKSGVQAKCRITVQKKAVKTTKVSVNKTKVTLKLKGGRKTFAITASKTPVTSPEKITYKSSNKRIATVSSKGRITAKRAGKTKITVKSGKKTRKITVTVKKK